MWICAGVVPQQPPTRLSRPSRAKPAITPALCSGVSSYSANAFGRPAFGRHEHCAGGDVGDRSREHTSELQSLMRSSYAVFCLKHKKNNQTKHITNCNDQKV